MRLVLSLLISISSYNIIGHHYNIDITDILPRLKADVDIVVATGMELKNPKNGKSVYLLNGDRISIKTTLDRFENYEFEYYDHSNGLVYISHNQKIMYAPTNKIHWIRMTHKKSLGWKILSPIIGAGVGTVGGAVYDIFKFSEGCMNSDNLHEDPPEGKITGTIVGGIVGFTLGTLAISNKDNSYGYATGKIHLTGKKAWEVTPVDADKIIQSYINTAKPID